MRPQYSLLVMFIASFLFLLCGDCNRLNESCSGRDRPCKLVGRVFMNLTRSRQIDEYNGNVATDSSENMPPKS